MLDGNFNFGEVASQPIYDPQTIPCTNPNGCTGGTGWTATQFPGNQIPLNRFDPVAVKFLSMTPYHLPNTAGGLTTTGPTNNYIANTHYLADKDGYLGRFDEQIRANNKVYIALPGTATANRSAAKISFTPGMPSITRKTATDCRNR